MKRIHLLIAIGILTATLAALLIIAGTMLPASTQDITKPNHVSEPTEPSSEPTAPTTEPTDPTNSTPTTEATVPKGDYIGSLYTRQELEAMENVTKEYSFGRTSDGKPAPYASATQKTYGKYAGNFIGPDNGCIYLTFDCGYEYNNLTASILDTLKEKNVKAVFFITLPYAQKNPELVRRMIDEGHAVGNHSSSHPVMPTLSIDEMVEEVMALHNYVRETYGYEMNLFRPPTGAYSTRSLAVVQSLGYKNVHWSFAYDDWEPEDQPSESYALKRITESYHSGAIYLLHAISQTNANVLSDAIDALRGLGYTLELFQ